MPAHVDIPAGSHVTISDANGVELGRMIMPGPPGDQVRAMVFPIHHDGTAATWQVERDPACPGPLIGGEVPGPPMCCMPGDTVYLNPSPRR